MNKPVEKFVYEVLDILDPNRRKEFVHVCASIEGVYKSLYNMKHTIQKIYENNNIYFSNDEYYDLNEIDEGEFTLYLDFYTCGIDRRFINYKLKKFKQEVKDCFNQLNYSIKFKNIGYDLENDDLDSYDCDDDMGTWNNIRANLNEQLQFINLKGVSKNG